MALTDSEGMNTTMLVSPANGFAGNGFGFGNDGGIWLILLFILLAGGNGFGNNGYGGNCGLYPWLNNSQNINDGFRDQLLNDNVTSIRDGIFGLSTQLCNGFAGTNAAIANGFAQSEIAANARQIADMQQNFALQSSLQNCCCENRASIADLKYTVATENCADRAALANSTRDIIENQTRSVQLILDKLCQQEIDALKTQNVSLQNQLNMAALRESQTAQNALIAQGFSNEVDALYNRLSSCPVPTTPVYGRTPIFTCGNNNGCGCGCGGSF
jgi:hypothetical protein